ncbi:hypothetical protein [Caballeronia sp. Sq4a]|uniref:hypothetical protein n=1 Tax=Caballeronia sp. Sq4a TaxID=2878152 RepID=UPI0020BF5391|nr:hypothetical protein [Caballeronia sp. Sq4a]
MRPVQGLPFPCTPSVDRHAYLIAALNTVDQPSATKLRHRRRAMLETATGHGSFAQSPANYYRFQRNRALMRRVERLPFLCTPSVDRHAYLIAAVDTADRLQQGSRATVVV